MGLLLVRFRPDLVSGMGQSCIYKAEVCPTWPHNVPQTYSHLANPPFSLILDFLSFFVKKEQAKKLELGHKDDALLAIPAASTKRKDFHLGWEPLLAQDQDLWISGALGYSMAFRIPREVKRRFSRSYPWAEKKGRTYFKTVSKPTRTDNSLFCWLRAVMLLVVEGIVAERGAV